MGHQVLSIASEWFSYHGGLSSFNRSICAALASAGHEVVCLIPRATSQEHEDAKMVGIKLVCPEPVPGLSDEALLCLDAELGFQPDIVIGHGHITGAVAAARVRQFHRTARRIHILHTLPDEIEPFKDREGEDSSQRALRKQDTEATLSTTANIAVAVGPRLHRQWSTYIGETSGVGVHRLTPGLADLNPVGKIPTSYWCLLMGRLEDAELKGVGLAAAALGIINKDKHFRGQREVTLVLRGAATGTSKELRSYVHSVAGAQIPITIREYTHQEGQIRQDIARSSVLLMPSQMEGFGLVGIEALAMGVPILVSQRSGFGELLEELIDTNPSLEFARRFIVDVGEGIKEDSKQWAEAIRSVLIDRERAFSQAAILREAILKADYWCRAVADLFGVLKIPPRDPKTPLGTPPDLTERAQKILDIDPAIGIVYSSSLLEREMVRVAAAKGIAKPSLPASQYLTLLQGKGFLNAKEADLAKKVLHLRNMAAHKFDTVFTKEQAEEHSRNVDTLIEKLRSNCRAKSQLVPNGDILLTQIHAGYQETLGQAFHGDLRFDVPPEISTKISKTSFWFMRNIGGVPSRSSRQDAQWIQCRVAVKFFNSREKNVGLDDIHLAFLKEGEQLLAEIPYDDTNRIVDEVFQVPPRDTLTLLSGIWREISLVKTLRNDKVIIASGCDEIFLMARTIDGETFKIKVGSGISEKNN